MSEWRKYKLGEVITFQRGHDLPQTSMQYGIYPVAGSNGVIGFHNKFTTKGPGLTIGRSGNIGTPNFYLHDFWAHNTVLYVKDFKGNNEKYIYYFLMTLDFTQFNSGSAVPSLNRNHIHELDVLIPSHKEQQSIASILSSLDDKIDLLHRQNKTLEAMAETLFRKWFVEEVKEEWEEVVITDLFEVRDGTHDSPKQKPIGKRLLTSKHILRNQLDFESAYLISEEDFDSVNKRSKVDSNDILFSMIGTIGMIYFEQSKNVDYAIKNIGLFKTSQNPIWAYYLYLWLKSSWGKDFIHEYRSGSTQEYISLGSLRSIVFNNPGNHLLGNFNQLVAPYFEKLRINISQIQTLTNIRDILLPKLMSGEVRVN